MHAACAFRSVVVVITYIMQLRKGVGANQTEREREKDKEGLVVPEISQLEGDRRGLWFCYYYYFQGR